MTAPLSAEPVRHLLPDGLVYFVDRPADATYPILLAIEGSRTGESIVRIHNFFSPAIKAGMALVTMERPSIDEDCPSQRLTDHIRLVEHLRCEHLDGWNGQLMVLGGSEGGPIAIKLAHAVDADACVAIVGCGDQSFREYTWDEIQRIRQTYGWGWPFIRWWWQLPADRAAYDAHCEQMKAAPDSTKWWFGQTYFYWADALDQREAEIFLDLPCPILVITGTEDIECASTDRLIAKAQAAGQGVTYLRIEGMGHDVKDLKWGVSDSIVDYLRSRVDSPAIQKSVVRQKTP